MACPLASMLIRIMIYIKNHKGSFKYMTTLRMCCFRPPKSFVSYYFVQSSLVYKYLELHTHSTKYVVLPGWCIAIAWYNKLATQ